MQSIRNNFSFVYFNIVLVNLLFIFMFNLKKALFRFIKCIFNFKSFMIYLQHTVNATLLFGIIIIKMVFIFKLSFALY